MEKQDGKADSVRLRRWELDHAELLDQIKRYAHDRLIGMLRGRLRRGNSLPVGGGKLDLPSYFSWATSGAVQRTDMRWLMATMGKASVDRDVRLARLYLLDAYKDVSKSDEIL